MKNYEYLFDKTNFEDEPLIHFIKSEDENMHNPVEMPESICSRLICIGHAYKMHYIPMFDLYGEIKFESIQIETLIEELIFISKVVNDNLLVDYTKQVIELAKNCVYGVKRDSMMVIGN